MSIGSNMEPPPTASQTSAAETATFNFIKWQPLYATQKPYEILLPLPPASESESTTTGARTPKVPRSNLIFEPHSVPVQDVRPLRDAFKLDIHGFEFVRHSTSVGGGSEFKQRSTIEGVYLPEMEKFLADYLRHDDDDDDSDEGVTGKEVKTVCFDYRIRESIPPSEFALRTVNLEDGFDPLLPATHPHVDQSTKGAIQRVKRHMGDDSHKLLSEKGRVRIINIWRPLHKVRSWPLALCDARTVNQRDLLTCDIVRRRYVGETLFAQYSEHQKWYYLSDMDQNDVVLIKVYDSDSEVEAKRKLHLHTHLSSSSCTA
ncbi:hypothetical protein QBC43DRAFT_286800 [Cladorrhinum sp. PSN259]|nr:hypothetical protein QBC43DRAFT_286800 [Cladorrhinum sp. PSN259]